MSNFLYNSFDYIQFTILYYVIFKLIDYKNYLLRSGVFYIFLIQIINLLNQVFKINIGIVFYIELYIIIFLFLQKLYYIDLMPRDKINKKNVMLFFKRNWGFNSYLECIIGGDNAMACCGIGDKLLQYRKSSYGNIRMIYNNIMLLLTNKEKYKLIKLEDEKYKYPQVLNYTDEYIYKYFYSKDTGVSIENISEEAINKVLKQPARQLGTFGLKLNCLRSLRPILKELGKKYEYKYFRWWFLPSIYLKNIINKEDKKKT